VKYTGLLLFPDLFAASDSIAPFRQAGAKALEIMDRASLRSVEDQVGTPKSIKSLPEGAAGLLVEFQASLESERERLEALAAAVAGSLKLLEPANFTHESGARAALWKIRAGMFPSVGSVRKSGTTVVMEDVAFPIELLAPAARDLTGLFRRHEYPNAIIFGHAKDGNLHFVITQSFNDRRAVDQYARFIDDVVELVVQRYDGALKAEHGTGRNMAPFVETEWGGEAYGIMREIKALADPSGLLNPGVIINADARAHLRDLKQFPTVEPEIDKCIECGYCESRCPSRNLTLTPRQRIAVRREMARQESRGSNGFFIELERDFPYAVLDTCAVDGLCATTCPVSIDTGKLVKRFRAVRNKSSARHIAQFTVEHFALLERLVRAGLGAGQFGQKIIGIRGMQVVTRGLRRLVGRNVPVWTAEMPFPTRARIPHTDRSCAKAVYFPSCISRTMGRLPGEASELSLMEILVALGERAQTPVWVPEDTAGNCCGTPYSSKGFEEARDAMLNRVIEKFYSWSGAGELAIVVDTSPCTYGLIHAREFLTPENQRRFDGLAIMDSIEFVHDLLLPNLTFRQSETSVALHPVCSALKMGLSARLEAIAKKCSREVFIPTSAGCCAFAGDRGFMFPELTESAAAAEAAEIKAHKHSACYSSSRTCEIGMTRHTGEVYRSYLYLLEKATRP
jgi:D-lactate dehydrogenase